MFAYADKMNRKLNKRIFCEDKMTVENSKDLNNQVIFRERLGFLHRI